MNKKMTPLNYAIGGIQKMSFGNQKCDAIMLMADFEKGYSVILAPIKNTNNNQPESKDTLIKTFESNFQEVER